MTGSPDKASADLTIDSSDECGQNLSIEEQRQLLNSVVARVLSNSPEKDVCLILPFIRRTLLQFHLCHRYDERDIFLDAYVRGIRTIESGKIIRKIPFWLKGTSFNIIREKARARDQQQTNLHLLVNSENMQDNLHLIPEYVVDYNSQKLAQAIKNISEKDWLILRLRIVESLSYEEIAAYLVTHNKEPENNQKLVQKLRKRYERSLKSLRKTYSSF